MPQTEKIDISSHEVKRSECDLVLNGLFFSVDHCNKVYFQYRKWQGYSDLTVKYECTVFKSLV